LNASVLEKTMKQILNGFFVFAEIYIVREQKDGAVKIFLVR
jgi:hypothetical protein